MGFLDKMKAANGFNFGDVESPDFPCATLIMKEKKLCIICRAINSNEIEYFIEQNNVREFRLLGCGGNWAKYYICFNDGKTAIITQPVLTQADRQNAGISMAPIERFLKLTVNNNNNSFIQNNQVETIKMSVCPKCGSPIDDEMIYCGDCGEKLK